MSRVVVRGFFSRRLRRRPDRHRDRARRRADVGHLHPHRHDQPVLRVDLHDGDARARRRRRPPPGARRDTPPSQTATIAGVDARAGARGARAWPSPRARSSRTRRCSTRRGKRLNTRAPSFVGLDAARRASRTSRPSAGALPDAAPARSRSTRRRRSATALRSARRCASPAPAPPRPTASRDRQVRRQRVLRRRRRRAADARRRPSASPASPAPSTRSSSAATPAVSAGDAARAHPRACCPRTLDVRTGAQEAAQQTSDLESRLGFLRTFLLIFAYVALFVGAFIIFNTFSITVAQRTREFGLLRMLGATRGQILRSVVAEGVMLGPRRRGARPARRARRSRPRSTSCSRPSAPICPTAARCSSSARSGCRCSPAPR